MLYYNHSFINIFMANGEAKVLWNVCNLQMPTPQNDPLFIVIFSVLFCSTHKEWSQIAVATVWPILVLLVCKTIRDNMCVAQNNRIVD